MKKISPKPFIYASIIGAAVGLGTCYNKEKESFPVESHYTTLPDSFSRSTEPKSEQIFGDTLVVFDDVKLPKRIRKDITINELIDGFKELYPENDYNFEINYRLTDEDLENGIYSKTSGDIASIEIINKNTDKQTLRIEFINNDADCLAGNINIRRSEGDFINCRYNEIGELYYLNVANDNSIEAPLITDIKKAVKEKNIIGLPTTSKNLLSNIQKITPQSVNEIDTSFSIENGEYLSDYINKAWWLDNDVKTKCQEHFDYCYSLLDGNKDMDKTESQVVNKYYTGDKYTKELKDGIYTVKNLRTGKETKYDINDAIKNLSPRNKYIIKCIFQNLPAEVIEDIAIEIQGELKQGTKYDDIVRDKSTFAFYHIADNSIKLLKPMYGFEAIKFVHEVGHALDFINNKTKNSSSFTKYQTTFEEELADYVNSGGQQYSARTKKGWYPTKNHKEMFAEFYTGLMLGKTTFDMDKLVTQFPKTFEAAKEHIKHIRSLPVEVRNKKYNNQ